MLTESLDVLRERHFVVLDGAPEVGKSTIAAAIGLQYGSVGFAVIDLRHPSDLFKVLALETRQIFIADDAVGSVAVDPTMTDEWSRDLPGILRRLDSNHLLVWTGRTYVIAEAVALSRIADTIANFPGVHEVRVTVGDLTRFEREEMLYNHAKYGTGAPLTKRVRALVKHLARMIIDSPNLTPERLRQLTADVLTEPAIDEERVAEFLANPGRRWVQAYQRLTTSEQVLLMALLDQSAPARTDDLRTAYDLRSIEIQGRHLSFDECLQRLSPGFLRTATSYQGTESVDFQHPSLRDLLITELRDSVTARRSFFRLASVHAIAAIIHGVAAAAQGEEDERHSVTPDGPEELELLLGRICELTSTPLAPGDWHEVFAATAHLLPTRPARRRQVATGTRISVSVRRQVVRFLQKKST